MIRRAAVLAVFIGSILLAGSCSTGPRAEDLAVVRTGRGATVDVWLPRREIRKAELLEAGDSALLLLSAEERVVRVPWEQVRMISMAQLTRATGVGRRRPPQQRLARWRSYARYSHGLTQTQLRALLDHHGQREVEEIR